MELALIKNDAEFDKALDAATGYIRPNIMPTIKFNGETGQFEITTGEIDDDGHPKYKPIGNKIDIHIITANRKMVKTAYGKEPYLYSKEYVNGDAITLYDNEQNEIDSGAYADLKEKHNLVYVAVLYLYYKDKPYRMKLSGSKLGNLFKYIRLGNPVKYFTTLSAGKELKKGKITYYELLFTRGKYIDRKIYIERINAVDDYLIKYQKSDTLIAIPKDDQPSIKLVDKLEDYTIDEASLPL
jgi:hypothetical protein